VTALYFDSQTLNAYKVKWTNVPLYEINEVFTLHTKSQSVAVVYVHTVNVNVKSKFI